MGRRLRMHADVQVRFSDTDGMGHVNNAIFLSYLEYARMQYWKELTGLRDFGKADFILARVELDYRSPVFPGETVRVHVGVPRLGGSSFDFAYRLEERDSGRLIAEGRTVQACYDYAKGKVKRLEADLREKILAFEAAGPQSSR